MRSAISACLVVATVLLVISGFFLFDLEVNSPSGSEDRSTKISVETEGSQIVESPILNTSVSKFPSKGLEEGLVDQDGNSMKLEDLEGRPVLLSFIYTSCPDAKMCPLLTQKMVQVQKKVNANDPESARFVSVTFDPETDTPETLKHYGEQKNADFRNWSFVTGPSDTIDRLTEWFNVKAKRQSSEEVVMLHNMRTYLLDSDLTVKYAWRGSKWSVEEVYEKLKKVQ